ncbi:MAG: glycosyltransferase family 2 protein [Lentisphaeria bacterium]|nr:glycosyltransferase family 2 protein [Lentisphaeria bacterium]
MISPVFIVVPCFREDPAVVRRSIAPLLAAGYRVVLVDDGSPEPLFLPDLPVVILRHPINRGQGAALQTGGDYALRQGAAAVVHFDADGQHDAAVIPRALEMLSAGQAEVVLGSRFLREEDWLAIPAGRRRLLRCARWVNGVLTGMWLTDAHNGFRVLSRKALEAICLKEDRMAHASEILSQIRRAGLRWKEIPTHIAYTEYSVGKGQRLGGAFEILTDLLMGRWL